MKSGSFSNNSYGLVDAVIWSSNTSILDKTHKTLPGIRLGYIPTNLNKFETFDEIGAVCRTAGKHYANQILIDTDILNKENVKFKINANNIFLSVSLFY